MVLILFLAFIFTFSEGNLMSEVEKNAIMLPPCEVCKLLVESFKKGIENTARGNFAGGDTAWEEKRLGSYQRSEVRLIEIQENLCSDLHRGANQCHTLAEEAEPFLETWWFKNQDSDPDLLEWLCIKSMKICCPTGHFGPNCEQCDGYPEKICSNNGKCKGAGTRSGNGECKCYVGYAGKFCDRCADNYFKSEETDKHICLPCHISCEGGCSDSTRKACVACKSGWLMDRDVGCVDVNECNKPDVCKKNEICINVEGSFSCQDAEKYSTRDPAKWVRYLIFISFCMGVYVFVRKNILLGSLVAIVAVYLSVSEIVMSPHVDWSKLDVGKLFGIS